MRGGKETNKKFEAKRVSGSSWICIASAVQHHFECTITCIFTSTENHTISQDLMSQNMIEQV